LVGGLGGVEEEDEEEEETVIVFIVTVVILLHFVGSCTVTYEFLSGVPYVQARFRYIDIGPIFNNDGCQKVGLQIFDGSQILTRKFQFLIKHFL
jgi:hypothetical protein